MRKRIGALGLAAALLLTLICPALAANGKAEFVVNAPASVKAGETFTVTVELRDNPGFSSLQFTVPYDSDVLDCTRVSSGAVLRDMLNATNPTANGGAKLAAAGSEEVTQDGQVAKLTFTAKADIGELQFELKDITFAGLDGAALPYSITGTGETAPASQDPTPADPSSTDPAPADPGGQTTDPTPADPGGQTTDPTPADPGGQTTDPAPVDPTPADPQPAEQIGFTDTAGHWAEAYIIRAAEMGLFKGYPDGSFGPNRNVTRAQFVTVLYRMAGSPAVSAPAPFTDIADLSQEFRDAIAWGYEKGFVNGRSADTFDPNGNVTRQEAMKILFGYDGGESGMEAMFTAIYDASFTDSGEIADWAKTAMYWGVYETIISGTSDTTLSPQGTATRAQLAKILTVYIDRQTKE